MEPRAAPEATRYLNFDFPPHTLQLKASPLLGCPEPAFWDLSLSWLGPASSSNQLVAGPTTKGGRNMTLGIGNLVALICIVISIIFAIVTNQATNALWWALLAIFAVLWWGARAPWGSS